MTNQIFNKFEFEKIDNYGKFLVKVYNNNAKKEWHRQLHYFSFKTEEARESYILRFIKNQQEILDWKAEQKAKRQAVVATEDLLGSIFYDSWGYDMTINDYIKIIRVTNKTVEAVRIGCSVENDYGRGEGKSEPMPNKIVSKPFKLSVREGYRGQVALVGQYYFCEESKRRGSFSKWEGGKQYFNTWD